MEPSLGLAEFWGAVLALSILIYVLLDGFDLGVGILFGLNRNEDQRRDMMGSIAPVWDGNETWLIIVGTVLFGAFPVVYAIFLSAFYLPVALLLVALILRGVAFEFRYKTHRGRWIWDWGFVGGSAVASFVQGAAIGAMVQGIRVDGHSFAGGPFDWLAPFPLLCGAGLVAGYTLLGASWLVLKTEGALRDWAYRSLPRLMTGVIGFVALGAARHAARRLPRGRPLDGTARALPTADAGQSRGLGALRGRATEARLAAVRHGIPIVLDCLPDAGRQLLALDRALCPDGSTGRGAGRIVGVLVLRGRDRRLADHPCLHGNGLLGLSWQGQVGRDLSLVHQTAVTELLAEQPPEQ